MGFDRTPTGERQPMNPIRPPEGHSVKLKALSRAEVHAMALCALRDNIVLRSRGQMSSANLVFDVLLAAAAKGTSIEQECQNHELAPSPNTVRDVLKES